MTSEDNANEWERLVKMPSKELRTKLLENGLRTDGAMDKTELVERLLQHYELSAKAEDSLVTNDGYFDDRFARNLLPIALIKSEEQIGAFSNAHLRQLLISHPRNAAIQLKHHALLEQVLTCWRELQGMKCLLAFSSRYIRVHEILLLVLKTRSQSV
ncbi:hypothetical protein D915_000573 [Fasciola hepatica]|uniref:SAP domain-containing protein n=1 Tax=Fasciola hepatica TaxID=6192 RepID=A0A4E0S060_FASHE|nr:hypothetical protein D915_000573 [Fasciola hepatica]